MKYIKSILLTLLVTLLALPGVAQDFEYEGIWYTVINAAAKTVKTKEGSYNIHTYSATPGNNCEGDVNIPAIVSDGDNDYTVVEIGTYGFYGCSGMTTINIPGGVESIGKSAFYGCSGLTTMNIPDGVTSIGNSAFSGCSGLTIINIPDSVTSIGGYTFSGCSSLTSINIPDGVTKIGGGTFDNCSGLTSINIPDGVTSIEINTFSGCRSLTTINIPDGVTSIGAYAFNACSGLTTINIPDGVTSIEDGTFFGCSDLTSINIPAGVTTIGENAFVSCSGLTSINIPDGVTSIERSTFSGCRGLTTINIPDGVTSIGEKAFENCLGLTSINIPDGVTSIESNTFSGCSSLTSINIPDGVTSIGNSAFYDCRGLTTINIPDGVTTIGGYVFCNCQGVTSVSIPPSIISIGEYAFNGIDSQVEITYMAEDLIDTYDNIFSDATYSLGVLYMPNATLAYVQTIGPWNNFQHIIAKDGSIEPGLAAGEDFEYNGVWYTVIDNEAHTCATKSGNPYEEVPGSSVEGNLEIPSKALAGSTEYTVVTISEYSFKFNPNLLSVTLPETIISIERNAFEQCTGLISINFPNSITSIGENAFNTCTSLLDVSLSENITTMGVGAFANCSALTRVVLPKKLAYIDQYTFDTCENLQTIVFNDGLEEIGLSAFSKNAVESLEFPESLIKIDDWAFAGSANLVSVILPSNLTKLGFCAFDQCRKLKTINFPQSLTTIDNGVFRWCDSLESVELPDNVTSLTGVFEGCPSLKSVKLPKNLKYLGNLTFRGCTNLTSIDFPDGLESIDGSFADCSGLSIVVLPESLTTLEGEAFAYCGDLKSVTLPTSLQVISDGAFAADDIEAIYYSASTPIEASEDSFNEWSFQNTILNMPNATLAEIEAVVPWNKFAHINAKDTYKVPVLENDSEIVYNGIVYVVIDSDQHYVKTRDGNEDDGTAGNSVEGDLVIPSKFTVDNNEYYVVEIGHHGFSSLDLLNSVTIEEGITKISYSAFLNCENLKSVSLPETLTELEGNVFNSCKSLESIELPSGLTEFGGDLMSNCSSLSSVKLPENLSVLPGSTFWECRSLTSIELPAGVTRIGGNAFWGCSSLASIVWSESLQYVDEGAFAGTGFVSVEFPEGVLSIERRVLKFCANLESITLPASLTYLADEAFDENNEKLRTVIYNAEYPIESGEHVFTPYEYFKEGTLYTPNALLANVLPYSPWNHFGKIVAKDDTYLMPLEEGEDFEYEGLWYTVIDPEAKTCRTKTGDPYADPVAPGNTCNGELIIPASVTHGSETYSVVEIGQVGFWGNHMTSVTIGNNVTNVGWSAFRECTEMTELNLPNSLISTEGDSFQSCIGLTSVVLPESLKTLGGATFSYCANLESVTIPAGLTELGGDAFIDCNKITEVNYLAETPLETDNGFETAVYENAVLNAPNASLADIRATEPWRNFNRIVAKDGSFGFGLTEGDDFEYEGIWYTILDSEAKTVKTKPGHIYSEDDQHMVAGNTWTGGDLIIPESVSDGHDNYTVIEIGSNSFLENDGISTVTLPASIAVIADEAFARCPNITSVSLNESLTRIGSFVFTNCYALSYVTIPSSLTEIGEGAFSGCDSMMEITYNASSLMTASEELFSASVYENTTLNTPNALLADVRATVPWNIFKHIVASNGSIGFVSEGIDFEYEGVWYTVINPDEKTVKTKDGIDFNGEFNNANSCEGALVLPNVVSNGSEDFTVIEIGRGSFYSNSIISVTIPSSVETIGDWAFRDCTQLTHVAFNEDLKNIGSGAFYGCSVLDEVALPDGVSHIGTQAFKDCSKLSLISLPESLTELSSMMFENCLSLSYLTIPSNIEVIGSSVFNNCPNLGGISLPEGLKTIEFGAFFNCSKLSSFTLPSTLTSLGENAFVGCDAIEVISLPSSLESIGSSAFELCNGIKEVTYEAANPISAPEDVFGVQSYVYENATLKTPNATLSTVQSTVPWNKFLRIIASDGSVAPAGEGEDFVYNGMTYTVIDADAKTCKTKDNWYSQTEGISDSMFTEDFEIPEVVSDGINNFKVIEIGVHTFYNCEPLRAIRLPGSLKKIGMYAFSACRSLASVNIPDSVISIENRAFAECEALTSIMLPESIETLGESVFRDCKALAEVRLPANLTSIPVEMFHGCVALWSVNFPSALTSIGDYAFYDCEALTIVELSEGIVSIGASAFSTCNHLSHLILPSTLIELGEKAFWGCNLTSLILPGSLTSIGSAAFERCEKINEVIYSAEIPITAPEDIFDTEIVDIYSTATLKTPNATLASVQATTPWNRFLRINASDGSIAPAGEGEDFEYEGLTYTVISVEDKTCRTKEGTVVDGAYVAGNSFEGELTIPATVSDGTYDYSVIEIGTYGFANCTTLTSVSIPTSIAAIPESAFNCCSNLQTVVLPESMTSISVNAFLGCSALTAITLPETLTSLGHGAFTNCSSLEAIVIPESLTVVDNQVFAGCSSLKSIDIPATLEGMGYGAFYGCDPDVEVTYRAETPIAADENAFGEDAYANGKLNTPNATLASVQATSPWNKFLRINASDGSIVPFATEVTLNPTTVELKVGETVTIEATVIPENATNKTVTWASDNEEVITVDSNGVVTAISLGEATITATCGPVSATCVVTVVPTPVESITLSNTSLNLTEGETATLTAIVAPADATDQSVTWTSSDDSVVTVSESGEVFAVNEGIATITATSSNGKIATCIVTVALNIIPVTNISISDTELNLVEGDVAVLTATVDPADATDQTVTWTSSDASVVTVSEDGEVIAVNAGTAVITASSSNGLTATCTITVDAKIIDATDLTLSLTSAELKVGETVSIEATVIPEDTTDKTVTWSSDNDNVATVDADGNITAISLGEAIITATCGSATATCTVTVVPTPVESVTLSNASLNLIEGETATLTATVDPADATDKTVTWTSSDASVATVSENGEVTAVNEGTAIITVTSSNGLTATCSVTVAIKIIDATDLTLNLTSAELKVGDSVTLEATVIPEDTTDKTVTWSSDNEEVATVDSNGTVTAISLGEAAITATCGSVSTTCNVIVVETPVESITLSDISLDLIEGETATLTATVTPADATDQTLTWTSSDTSVASVSENGEVTALKAGTAIITASSSNGMSATCIVTVDAKIIDATDLTLSLTSAELKVGETVTIEATVIPEDATDKTVTWTSDNDNVATVDAEGNITAFSIGEATITATCGSVTATCKVTVVPTPVESVTLSNTALNLTEGETAILNAIVAPADATDQTVTWTSSDASVATVSESGEVVAIKEGIATVTATSSNGMTATCTVTVASNIIPVTNISISNTELTLIEGDVATLIATVTPADATDQTVTWTSSDTSVVTVSEDGEVVAVSAGTAIITASSSNGKTATCSVTVEAKIIDVTDLTLNLTSAELKVGETVTLEATVIPADATDKTVTWRSSDTSVATVSANGVVMALKVGIATITATASNGKIATCNVTVVRNGNDFEYNGLWYTVINEYDKTVKTKSGVYNYEPQTNIPGNNVVGDLTIPAVVSDGLNEYSVVEIGSLAFCYCSELTSINIPESVTTISSNAFDYCSGLTSVNIPESVTTIGSGAFGYCSALTSVNIPESVTSIEHGTFDFCTSLSSINIPESVTSIGYSAFLECSALTSIKLPKGLTSIGMQAFWGCRSLSTIEIPEGINSINESTFRMCSGLTSIRIPDNVTEIRESAFDGCSSLTSINIPAGVTSFGELAFNGCNALTSITYQAEVPIAANENIFSNYSQPTLNMPNATLTYVKATVPWNKFLRINAADGSIAPAEVGEDFASNGINYTVIDEENRLLRTKSGNLETGEPGNTAEGNLVIPETVTYNGYEYTVTEIGSGSFSGNQDLLSVTIPGTVNNIPTDAFAGCERLTSIVWQGNFPLPIDEIDNPNILVYVDDAQYAPEWLDHNIVADGVCDNLVLTPGFAFTPLTAFTAEHSEITKSFTQLTPMGGCAGWETLAIPFEPTSITVADGRALVPFSVFTDIDTQCPFWLYEADADGEWKEASAIRQSVPYILSMPNNDDYAEQYRVDGEVTFMTDEETLIAPETCAPYVTTWNSGREFRSLWLPLSASEANNAMGLNVGISNLTGDDGKLLAPGSAFHADVLPLPLEAYVTRIDGRRAMPVRGDQSFVTMMGTEDGLGIAVDLGVIILSSDRDRMVDVFTMDGIAIRHAQVKAGVKYRIENLTRGIYIVAGRKITVK